MGWGYLNSFLLTLYEVCRLELHRTQVSNFIWSQHGDDFKCIKHIYLLVCTSMVLIAREMLRISISASGSRSCQTAFHKP